MTKSLAEESLQLAQKRKKVQNYQAFLGPLLSRIEQQARTQRIPQNEVANLLHDVDTLLSRTFW